MLAAAQNAAAFLFYEGIAHYVELLLTRHMPSFDIFQRVIVKHSILCSYIHHGAASVNPMPAAKGTRPEFLGKHRSRIFPIRQGDRELP